MSQLNSFILSNLYLAPVGFYIRHVLIDKQSNRMASAIITVQAFSFELLLQNFFHVFKSSFDEMFHIFTSSVVF